MLIEVHYRKVDSQLIGKMNTLGILENHLTHHVTKGQKILLNTDKIVHVNEWEASTRKCANVFTDDGEAFKLYESMNEIAAMASCVRSFK